MFGFGKLESLDQYILFTCGLINVGIAILHIYIIFVGAPAYRYFGAGEWMAQQAEKGSSIPDTVTWSVTAVFCVFALYNFVAAKFVIASLPWLVLVVLAISVIYILRGSVVVAIPFMGDKVSSFDKISSYISLLIGLLNLYGVYLLHYKK